MAMNTASERPAGWTTTGPKSVDGLGERLDGWAELIEGARDKADEVVKAFQERISVRQMPEVAQESSGLTTGGLTGKQRPYQLVHTRTGATLTVYIGQFGRDLYVAWDLFVRPVWNQRVILGILGAAAVLGLLGARDSLSGWIAATIGLSIFFAVLVAGAGLMLKRNPLAFFWRELTFFDADDITAITLAVHKSLLQAIDVVGIDTQLLRVKEQFHGGRRDRLI